MNVPQAYPPTTLSAVFHSERVSHFRHEKPLPKVTLKKNPQDTNSWKIKEGFSSEQNPLSGLPAAERGGSFPSHPSTTLSTVFHPERLAFLAKKSRCLKPLFKQTAQATNNWQTKHALLL
jgi:hypothetical protein